MKFLNEAKAGHESHLTIDFVPSFRFPAQKRSAVHHPIDIIGIIPQRVSVAASASVNVSANVSASASSSA